VPEQYLIAGDFDRDWLLRGDSEPRTDVEVLLDGAAVKDYTEGATATVSVAVTDELGAVVSGLLPGAFEFRVDGELRAASHTGGSYTFTLPLAGFLQHTSVDTDPGLTSYDLTVEVVRPDVGGRPVAGLGRARFRIQ